MQQDDFFKEKKNLEHLSGNQTQGAGFSQKPNQKGADGHCQGQVGMLRAGGVATAAQAHLRNGNQALNSFPYSKNCPSEPSSRWEWFSDGCWQKVLTIRERQVQSLRLRRQREQQLGRFLEEPGEEAGEEALRRGSSRKGRVEEEADSVQRVCAAFYHWLDRRLDQCASAGPIRCWMPGVERTEEEGLPCS